VGRWQRRLDGPAVHLKQAPRVDVVEGRCGACHSLDFVPMNSPFLDAAHWDAEVAKMIKAFGAPIGPADTKTIGDLSQRELRGLKRFSG
jgi:sulfite dehydrogenase (cytochrome) subunit B